MDFSLVKFWAVELFWVWLRSLEFFLSYLHSYIPITIIYTRVPPLGFDFTAYPEIDVCEKKISSPRNVKTNPDQGYGFSNNRLNLPYSSCI